ncbi:MAG: glycosyltransferase family 1 protein [Kastovskya adunca ATA6-11-RM4]|jgi:hypothetical protein|nr:glycosyltransferase family 1 protein [Kastovskya adunca ATA6-11-RM4]
MVIIQVVPKLPPAINGLGDYALSLARQLRQEFAIETHFIVGDPSWEGAEEIEGFPISTVSERSSAALLSLLLPSSSATLLLHYVGYGYAKRGCPVWLVDGLQRWRAGSTQRRLVTMFHELHAFGPPWTSSFWLSPLQKNLVARLVKLSDRALTNRQLYAKTLYHLSQDKQIEIPTLPVFSNIGEPKQVPPLAERQRRLVVFGHPNSRLLVYQQCLLALEQTCKALNIEEICDIGVPTRLNFSDINGIPIVQKGVTDATEISELLLNSLVGFLNFPPPDYLAKSTIFAAYCAHKLIPVLVTQSAVPIDGLQAGKHYWVADAQNEQLGLPGGQAIADNAYNWYQAHNLSVQAKIFAALLEGNKQVNLDNYERFTDF